MINWTHCDYIFSLEKEFFEFIFLEKLRNLWGAVDKAELAGADHRPDLIIISNCSQHSSENKIFTIHPYNPPFLGSGGPDKWEYTYLHTYPPTYLRTYLSTSIREQPKGAILETCDLRDI